MKRERGDDKWGGGGEGGAGEWQGNGGCQTREDGSGKGEITSPSSRCDVGAECGGPGPGAEAGAEHGSILQQARLLRRLTGRLDYERRAHHCPDAQMPK